MRRYLTPAWILGVCLVVSLSIHLPVYGVLGVLKEVFLRQEAEAAARGHGDDAPVELNFDAIDDETPVPADTPPTPKDLPEKKKDEKKAAKQATAQPKKAEPKKAVPVVALAQPKPVAPPKVAPQAVKQKSQDPNAEPPPNTQYIAEENSRVEKETVAKVRNYQRDDANPNAAAKANTASEEPGMDSEEDKVADARDKKGAKDRHITEEEAKQERPDNADDTPPPAVLARGDGRRQGGDSGGASQRTGAAPVEYKTVTVSDGFGTFLVRVPKEQGAEVASTATTGTGLGKSGAGAGAGAAGRATITGLSGQDEGFSISGPRIRPSFAEALDALDPDELEKDRRFYVEERKSRLRGGKRQAMWKEFRAAMENFTPAVQPGNQTALNAAASPFAEYLAAVHRRIHREYAEDYIPSLPMGDSPYSDPSLMTKLEIILNRNGTVHRVGIVKPSGVMPFDYGAYASVMNAQPFPEAPSSILSADGRVYFHWGFYRNQRQCGTFNAEPYILPNPPRDDMPSDMQPGGPMPGGVLPSDAVPSWQAPTKEGRAEPPKGDREKAPVFADVHRAPTAG